MDRTPTARGQTVAAVLRFTKDTRLGHNSLAGLPSTYDPVGLRDRAADLARDVKICAAHTPDPEGSVILACMLDGWARTLHD